MSQRTHCLYSLYDLMSQSTKKITFNSVKVKRLAEISCVFLQVVWLEIKE